jgi:hypothetical protein
VCGCSTGPVGPNIFGNAGKSKKLSAAPLSFFSVGDSFTAGSSSTYLKMLSMNSAKLPGNALSSLSLSGWLLTKSSPYPHVSVSFFYKSFMSFLIFSSSFSNFFSLFSRFAVFFWSSESSFLTPSTSFYIEPNLASKALSEAFSLPSNVFIEEI